MHTTIYVAKKRNTSLNRLETYTLFNIEYTSFCMFIKNFPVYSENQQKFYSFNFCKISPLLNIEVLDIGVKKILY